MLTLAIEISNPGGASEAGGASARAGVALGEGTDRATFRTLGVEWLCPASRHDDALMPAIDALCKRSDVSAKDVSRVAVSIGPGGYTSLRIAVTTAKMLCEATGAQCVPVPTAFAVAHAAALEPGTRAVVGLAWKSDSAWRQRFEIDVAGEHRALDAGELCDVRAFDVGADEVLIADAELENLLRASPSFHTSVRVVRPSFDPSAVLLTSIGITPIDPLALAPMYPREPEAVTKWRVLHPESGV